MAMKFKPEKQRQTLRPADDLFGAQPETDGVRLLRIADLVPFAQHPFRVADDAEMDALADSIRENGVLVPIVVRAQGDGAYEILSGHRRAHAAQRIGLTQIPALVRELDDDAATILMVDSNLQREQIRPSEKAAAYRMRMEAMKRQAGRPRADADAAARSLVGKESRTLLAEQIGESEGQIQRYIRLNYLAQPLLDAVDDGAIPLNAGVALSYLPKPAQQQVAQEFAAGRMKLTIARANALRDASRAGTLDMLLLPDSADDAHEKPAPSVAVRINGAVYRQFFGDTAPRKAAPVVERALKLYFEQYGE